MPARKDVLTEMSCLGFRFSNKANSQSGGEKIFVLGSALEDDELSCNARAQCGCVAGSSSAVSNTKKKETKWPSMIDNNLLGSLNLSLTFSRGRKREMSVETRSCC